MWLKRVKRESDSGSVLRVEPTGSADGHRAAEEGSQDRGLSILGDRGAIYQNRKNPVRSRW